MKQLILSLFALAAALSLTPPSYAAEEDRPSTPTLAESVLQAVIDNAQAATDAAAEQGGQVEGVVNAVVSGAIGKAQDALQAVKDAETPKEIAEAAKDAAAALDSVSDATSSAAQLATALNAPETAEQLEKVKEAAGRLSDVVADKETSAQAGPKSSRSLTAAARDYIRGADRVDAARKALEEAKETLAKTEDEVSGSAAELRNSVTPADRYRAFNLGDGDVLVVVFRTEGTEIISLQAPGL